MSMTMTANTRVTTLPLTIRAARGLVESLAQKIVEEAQKAGIKHSYGAWVGDVMAESHRRSMLHPANTSTISQAWPYRNRLRSSYCDLQICLAVQVAIILEIGDRLDANTSAAAAEDADISLRHSVTEAQIQARGIIEQLVAANPDGVDQDAPLYRLNWFRKWDLITAIHDNFDES